MPDVKLQEISMDKHLKYAQEISRLLDNNFSVFGYRFGIDPIVGLIPFAGDVITGAFGLYMVWIAWKLRLPGEVIRKIVLLTLADVGLSFIPLAGDVGDFFLKSNKKAYDALQESYVKGYLTNAS